MPVRLPSETDMTLTTPVYGALHTVSRKGIAMATADQDWTKPAAMAIPPEGYHELERGRYVSRIMAECARQVEVLATTQLWRSW